MPQQLADGNVVHYFIYRDPRDVVVSEAHYLRDMNRWHRLTPYFRKFESIDDAIMLSINGLEPPVAGIDYPEHRRAIRPLPRLAERQRLPYAEV